ncbi:hypothetical protein Ahy_B09g096490 isoform A [Arachis hypogaea]|uniref:PsbP C-terminal domain-containing protein n=1 Tax=Arachis hypogaea TaxID=3818 RepID=A0A444XL77_ARAHY|nr:hypothetical protein Ahy_B09g096490 isoform A [Arachis hypogaea]
MALQCSFISNTLNRFRTTHCCSQQQQREEEQGSSLLGSSSSSSSPAEQFAPLANRFQRRLLVGVGSASLVAVGANFAGITSFLLGLSPENGRNLKLDVLYPVGGYSRCLDTREGFGAAKKRELELSLDPPALNATPKRSNFSEPVVAFGPPGSTGELNRIEAFGGPEEVGEAVDSLRNAKYYEIEFRVESPSFRRHNVAVCCARHGKLFTLNAQAPESAWPRVKSDFYRIVDSFSLTA